MTDTEGGGRYDENSNNSEVDEAEKADEATGGGQILPTPPIKKVSPKKKTDHAFAVKEILVQLGHLT
jgi:hypothetical protein